MTTRPDVAGPLPRPIRSDEGGGEAALRQMMSLTDDIIADIRSIDGVSTFAMLLARHEFALHLAMIGDTDKINQISGNVGMNKPGLTAAETCEYISDMAFELSRLAKEAGASQLSKLLTEVVERAEDFSRKQQSVKAESTPTRGSNLCGNTATIIDQSVEDDS